MATASVLALSFFAAMLPAGLSAEAPPRTPQSLEPLSFSLPYSYRFMEGLETHMVSPSPTHDHLNDVAFAPDGHLALAVGSHDTLVAFDPANLTARVLRNGTLGNLWGVAWSADSTTALAVGFNGTLVRYTGAGIQDLPAHGNATWYGVAWFPAVGFLVVGAGGGIFSLSGDIRTDVNAPTTNDLYSVAYNPVSNSAVAVGRTGTIVEISAAGVASNVSSPVNDTLWSVGFETDTGLGRIVGGVGVLLSYQAGVAANESHAPTEGGYNDLSVLDSNQPAAIAVRNASTAFGSVLFHNATFSNWVQLPAGFTGIEAVAWNPSGSYVLATGFYGATFIVRPNGTWQNFSDLYRASILDGSWRPTGDIALLAGFNGTLLLYDRIADTTVRVPIPNITTNLRSVSWAPNGTEALVVGANTFWRIAYPSLSVTAPIGNTTLDLYAVAFRPNGSQALVAGANGFIGLWDGAALTPVSALAQNFYALKWHVDTTGTGDYAFIVGSNLVAKFSLPNILSSTARIGTFYGVAFVGDDVWIAGDPHQLQKYDSVNGIWDNVSLPVSLNSYHFSGIETAPSGNTMLLVGYLSGTAAFTAYVNESRITRFDVGFFAFYQGAEYNPVTHEPLLFGLSRFAAEVREGYFPNLAPTAVVASPTNGSNWTTADTVRFDASGSSDPDVDSLSYAWFDNTTGYLAGAVSFGSPLAAGDHTITVFVDDGRGHNVSASVSVHVSQAQFAPVAVISTPNGTLNFTDDDNITFSGLDSYDQNPFDTLSYVWRSSVHGLFGTASVVVAKLPVGTHTITLTVTDNTGRSGNATLNLTVRQGDLPPLLSVRSPSTGTLYAANLPISFDARDTVDLDSATFTVTWYIDGTEFHVGAYFNATLAQGTHSVRVVASDGTKSSQLTFDIAVGPPVNQRPKFLSIDPPEGTVFSGNAVFNGTCEPDAAGPVQFVELRIEDGSWVRALGTTTWSIIIDTTPYPNGAVNVTFHAYDGEFDVSVVLRYIVDNPVVDARPTVDIVTPVPAATVRGSFTMGGTAEDPEGHLTAVDYRESGGAWKSAQLSGTSWTATLDSAAHPNGPFLIEVRAFDGQNYSDVVAVTVIADNPSSGGGFLPGLEVASAVVALGSIVAVVRFRRAGGAG